MRNDKDRIVMVVSNAFDPDPRVYREAKSLVEHGFKVTVFAWDRECSYSANEVVDGIVVKRIHIRSEYGNRFKIIVTAPLFWMLVSLRILFEDFDIIHCHDFDTLIVGIAIKLVKNRSKLVYDSHECYSLMISQELPKFIILAIERLETLFSSFANAIITASEDILSNFMYHPNSTIIHNYPTLNYVSESSSEKRIFKKKKYSVICVGGLSEERCILELVQAITELNNEFEVSLKLAGKFVSEAFKEKVESNIGYSYVDFLGWLPDHQQVIGELYEADIAFLCVKSKNQITAAMRSNRLFESMAAGIPVIASNFPEWTRVVKGIGCGVTVNPESISDIKDSINRLLRDPHLRKLMSRKAVQAVKEKFSWESEKQNLLDFYKRV